MIYFVTFFCIGTLFRTYNPIRRPQPPIELLSTIEIHSLLILSYCKAPQPASTASTKPTLSLLAMMGSAKSSRIVNASFTVCIN